jgi:hypothetical protein
MSRRGSKRLYVPVERISDDDENDDQPLMSIRKAPKRGQAGEPNMQGPGQVSASLRGRV